MNRFALGLVAALIATPAFAHAHLLQEQPADKSVVSAAPQALTLRFSEGVQLAFTGVAVTGPDGSPVAQGKPSLAANDDKLLTVPLGAPLPAGRYSIAWHALATDGHKTQGTYSFTVK